MRSLDQSSPLRQRSFKVRSIMLAVTIAIIIAAVPQPSVYSLIDSGGDASNGSGGAHSTNGWGWYNYPTSGGISPAGYRNDDNWPRVSGACAGVGADRVISFINLKPNITGASRPSPGTDASKGVVYNYLTSYSSPGLYSAYNGDAGGDWLPTSKAQSIYDSIPDDKSNFTWGVNVAWFCYDSTPLDFSLTPSISTNPSDAVEAGTKITVSPVVINSGTTPSSTVTYELNSFLVAPGNDVPRINSAGYYDSKLAPCDFYIGTGVSKCDRATFTVGANTGDFSYPVGPHKYLPDRKDVADDLVLGTKVCYAHSVKPRSHAATDEWRHSNPACITIGIEPKVQILGSDLLVGRTFMGLTAVPGNIQTSTSVRTVGSTVMTLGSWVEYGVQASGKIVGIGSGSAYGGDGLANAHICNASPLTFTNGTNSKCADNGTFGGYQANQNIPDVGSSFPITSSASLGVNPSVDLSSRRDLQGLYTATGKVRVDGGTINSGRWVVLNVPYSTVTITGNINYTNANLNSAGDIPQVVIIAKNINIQPGVDNVDAWLIAKGSATADGIINTCATSVANDYKKLSPCDNKLTVNGPVMANKVYLRRTSNSSTGVPAEVFNLRPDAYMWAYARSVGGARVQTVYSTELPPRL